MGLDTSHGCWHGAYSAFNRWREEIARAAGLPPLGLMDGFWSSIDESHPSGLALSIRVDLDTLKRYVEKEHPGAYDNSRLSGPGESQREYWRRFEGISWDCLKPDPLHVLLGHSDCEGEIAPVDCGPIADRLEALLPLLPADDDKGHIGNWRKKTETFIAGLRAAAAAGEPVDFH